MEVKQPSVFIRLLNKLFRWNGYFVASYPYTVIIGMLVFTLIASAKIPFTQMKDDFKIGYTPDDARSLKEMKIYNEFSNGDLVMLMIFITAHDGNNMLRMSHLNASIHMIHDIASKYAVKNLTYYDICDSFCNVNEPIVLFRNALLLEEQRLQSQDKLDTERINLSFPIMTVFNREFDLSPYFFGVTAWNSCDQPLTAATNIKEMKMIRLIFRANMPKQWTNDDLSEWNRLIVRHLENDFNYAPISPKLLSMPYTQDEIVRTAKSLFPYLAVGFIIMCSCALIMIYISAKMTNQWTPHKASYAINACICPLLASASSLGSLFWVGYRFGSVLLVVPFLTLAIGVDDAFIMISAWERLFISRTRHPQPEDSIQKWTAELLMDVGPSIMITSLTNTIAFGIGAFVPTPEIRLFCIASSYAMLMDFLYSITVFTAILVIGARYDIQHQIWTKEKCCLVDQHENAVLKFFLDYCKWLSNKFTRTMLVVAIVTYWGISAYGISQVKPSLTPSKLFIRNSSIVEADRLRNIYLAPQYTFVSVFINNVGNLSSPERVHRIKSLVNGFEAIEGCNGPQSTLFWIRAYEKYFFSEEADIGDAENDGIIQSNRYGPTYTVESIKDFIEWEENRHWGGFMKFDNYTNRLEKFFFTVAYHGQSLSAWNAKLLLLEAWRSVADAYPDLSVSIFEENAQFMDQLKTLVPLTIQNSLCTLVVMIAVCFLFMYNMITVIITSISIISIFVGVLGILTLWSIDLDPISLSVLILTVGLSVEFSAHISYHYYRTNVTGSRNAIYRMAQCLAVIALPLLQCCIATLLYIFCVIFVNCYLSEIFFKAVIVVMLLGILHALVFIPAILCVLTRQ